MKEEQLLKVDTYSIAIYVSTCIILNFNLISVAIATIRLIYNEAHWMM